MTFCGLDCCGECAKRNTCGGCEACNGHPFGGTCIAAEAVRSFGPDGLQARKRELIDAVNALRIEGLHVDDLNLLNGFYVNLEYPLPGGGTARFLNDADIYFGNQIEREGSDRCYGVVAGNDFILVCEYGCNGTEPVLVTYRRL